MTDEKQHFPDTNIILSPIIDNDSKEAEEYLKNLSEIYISDSVYDEAENVLNKLKDISLKLNNYIHNYAQKKSINATKINMHKFKIKKNFLQQYDDKEYPERIKKSNFINIINDIFNDNEIEINDILLGSSPNKLTSNIKISFKNNINKLDRITEPHKRVSFIGQTVKFNDLTDMGVHKSDAKLLDEAYQLQFTSKKPVYFATNDEALLKLKLEILKNISADLIVSKPGELIEIKA